MNTFSKEFILKFYDNMEKYFIHIENSMLSLLKLYVSIFMILGPVLSFLRTRYNVALVIISILLFVVGLLGLYILAMYLELRIRKIKVLEQIVIIRDKIQKEYQLEDLIKMPKSIEECPPYLRRPCSEWYTVIFLSFLNSIALAFGFLFLVKSLWVAVILLTFLFLFQFLSATKHAYLYDLKREDKYGTKNKYEFLNPYPYFPALFSVLSYIANIEEKMFTNWYNANCLKNKKKREAYNKIDCEFCKMAKLKKETIGENKHFFIKWDNYPVSKGHALIIPKRHICSLFELKNSEIMLLYSLLKRASFIIKQNHDPDGFNIGINEGEVAGQTKSHLHIHLIPRYKGDVKNPEGGVRNVIPGKGKYKRNH